MKKEVKYTWIEKFQLWDCTDETLHGGGITKETAFQDYLKAVQDEQIAEMEGWST